MLFAIEKKNSNNHHKSIQVKRVSRFIQVLKSFDKNLTTKKQMKYFSIPTKQKTNKKLLNLIPQRNDPQNSTNKVKGYPFKFRNNENFSTISKSSQSHDNKTSLNSMSLQINLIKQRDYKNENVFGNQLQTQTIQKSLIKLPKIRLHKVQGAPTGNLVQFLRLKPTEKYFSKRQNVRLAQKLLLAKPSKDLSRCEHQKFYNEQKSYRSISQSRLKNYKSFSTVLKKHKNHKHSKSQWID